MNEPGRDQGWRLEVKGGLLLLLLLHTSTTTTDLDSIVDKTNDPPSVADI